MNHISRAEYCSLVIFSFQQSQTKQLQLSIRVQQELRLYCEDIKFDIRIYLVIK